jgi:steroid 5-alpha reductase family enzyme
MTGVSLALIGLGTILTASTLVWMISVRLEDASIADVCWGLGFVLLAWLYCLQSPTLTPRSWLVAALSTLWGARPGCWSCGGSLQRRFDSACAA